jgi:hypothetical protein
MRQSDYIEYAEASRFIDAAVRAYEQDCEWNHFITLCPEMANVRSAEVSMFCRSGISRLKKYHQGHDMTFCCGWVLENSSSVGIHIHILIHKPNHLPIHPMTYWWAILKRFQLGQKKEMLRSRGFYKFRPYEVNICNLTGYLLKGIRPEACSFLIDNPYIKFGPKFCPQFSGTVIGKRIGWINPTGGGVS